MLSKCLVLSHIYLYSYSLLALYSDQLHTIPTTGITQMFANNMFSNVVGGLTWNSHHKASLTRAFQLPRVYLHLLFRNTVRTTLKCTQGTTRYHTCVPLQTVPIPLCCFSCTAGTHAWSSWPPCTPPVLLCIL